MGGDERDSPPARPPARPIECGGEARSEVLAPGCSPGGWKVGKRPNASPPPIAPPVATPTLTVLSQAWFQPGPRIASGNKLVPPHSSNTTGSTVPNPSRKYEVMMSGASTTKVSTPESVRHHLTCSHHLRMSASPGPLTRKQA